MRPIICIGASNPHTHTRETKSSKMMYHLKVQLFMSTSIIWIFLNNCLPHLVNKIVRSGKMVTWYIPTTQPVWFYLEKYVCIFDTHIDKNIFKWFTSTIGLDQITQDGILIISHITHSEIIYRFSCFYITTLTHFNKFDTAWIGYRLYTYAMVS